jgi:MoaA/NifB/PqqE/SkfB family radical SAM enzyme
MKKILTIYSTNECNFNCSFCIQKTRINNLIKTDEDLILNHLKENNYDIYVFSGENLIEV